MVNNNKRSENQKNTKTRDELTKFNDAISAYDTAGIPSVSTQCFAIWRHVQLAVLMYTADKASSPILATVQSKFWVWCIIMEAIRSSFRQFHQINSSAAKHKASCLPRRQVYQMPGSYKPTKRRFQLRWENFVLQRTLRSSVSLC